ncbi:hypothetical protein LXA43DRAFT_560175 [Ganoderma leucocontextum]|nr:hypothetical protein LXA43DRAFT_560175 [Ganoderma leucocontextum]
MPRFRSSSHPPAPSEPLFVLADLQEFGAPGQGGAVAPLASRATRADATATPSPTSSSFKRLSDMSIASVLSFRDDTKLDYTRATTPVILVRPGSSAQQQEMPALNRMSSFGALLSPDPPLASEALSLQNLPIPRRKPVASPDTGSSSTTSRRNGRIFPPPSSFGARPFSVMSASTEQDWLAFTAELRSPRKPIPEAPPMKGLGSFSNMFSGEIIPRGMIRDSLGSAPASVPNRWSERQAASTFHNLPLLSPPPQHAHSSEPHRLSFVPSLDSPLSSSTSSSSLQTPSLPRGSSSSFSAHIASQPVTPASSSAPNDAADPSSNAKLDGIIEESLFVEEAAVDYRHSRRSTDETETIRLEELMDEEVPPPDPPHSSPDPPRLELSFLRDEDFLPSRSDSLLWSPSTFRTEPRTHSRSEPSRNPKPTRRPPPLQLMASNLATSSAYAPPAEAAATSSSSAGMQPTIGSQRRPAQALPPQSHSSLPVTGSIAVQPAQRSSVIMIEDVLENAQQHFVVERGTQPPFGKLRSRRSSDSLPAPQEGSPYTPCTPEFAPPPSEYSPVSVELPRLSVDTPSPYEPEQPSLSPSPSPSPYAEHQHQHANAAWAGMRKWNSQTPLPIPSSSRLSPSASAAPPSPVVSVHSDHSVKGSIRSGITKLFGIGGRSLSGSRSGAAPKRSLDSTSTSDGILPPSSTSTVSLASLVKCKKKERRLKEAAARARTEQLAEELADTARRRAEEAKTQKAAYVQEKTRRPWEETGSMHMGLSYL